MVRWAADGTGPASVLRRPVEVHSRAALFRSGLVSGSRRRRMRIGIDDRVPRRR